MGNFGKFSFKTKFLNRFSTHAHLENDSIGFVQNLVGLLDLNYSKSIRNKSNQDIFLMLMNRSV